MGAITKLFERRSESLAQPGTWLYNWITGGGDTASGAKVNEATALRFIAVFACINVIATDVATMPLHLYRRLDRGKERAAKHPLYKVLHRKPNPELDSAYLRLLLQGHLLGWGNLYAFIARNEKGYAAQLWPFRPDRMRVERKAGELRYFYNDGSGKEKDFHREDVFHVKGLGFDGILGYSPIRVAREAIGVGLAAQEYGGSFFRNDARPSVVLRHPKSFKTKEAHQRLRKDWEESYGGSKKSYKPAILEEGMEVETIGIPPEDAQFIQSRKFQVTEICRLYRVPPHKIMDLENATYSNISEQSVEYVKDTIRPWCKLWESAILDQLIPEEDQDEYFAEFLLDDLMRGDIVKRYESYAKGRQWGWMSANDVREKENMNPIKGGDTYLVPLNMNPVEGRSAMQFDILDPTVPDKPRELRYAVPIKRERREAKNYAIERLRIAKSFMRVFEEAGLRVIKREVKDIQKALKDHLRSRSNIDQFNLWLDSYYQDYPEVVESIMSPAFFSYGEEIQAAAAGEIGAPVGMTPGLDECMKTHVVNTSRYHVNSSKGQINSLIATAIADNEDPVELITKRTEKWLDVRPGQIAAWETTRTNGLMTKAVYFYAGVPELEWVELDGNPYCRQLDGTSVEMGHSCRTGHFVGKGDVMHKSKRSDEFKPAWNVVTPPLWLGCTCGIIARV